MAYARRILFFLATNLAVVFLLGVVLRVLGLDPMGGHLPLLVMSAVIGFGGSFISLLLSKWMAKRSTGARVIEQAATPTEAWLLDTVAELSQKAGIGMPEVAVFPSPSPNAFATGARRDASLVAVSTGLLQHMDRREVRAVLAHEIAHVANGDMVTLALLQGVVNTFVVFLARIVGSVVDAALSGNDEDRRGPGMGYWITSMVAELVLGVFASIIVMWYSRRREFRADAGAAELVGAPAMIAALARLESPVAAADPLPQDIAAFGIQSAGVRRLFSSHPAIPDRIAALEAMGRG